MHLIEYQGKHSICALRRQQVLEWLNENVKNLYSNSKSRICVAGGISESSGIEAEVHQDSAFSPLLFILVMEEATRPVNQDESLELLYADSQVFVEEAGA